MPGLASPRVLAAGLEPASGKSGFTFGSGDFEMELEQELGQAPGCKDSRHPSPTRPRRSQIMPAPSLERTLSDAAGSMSVRERLMLKRKAKVLGRADSLGPGVAAAAAAVAAQLARTASGMVSAGPGLMQEEVMCVAGWWHAERQAHGLQSSHNGCWSLMCASTR